jgi:hypothetical protein
MSGPVPPGPERPGFPGTALLTLDLDAFAPTRSAVISPCGRYRYRLDRRWADGPSIAWIMLNPSTADSNTDDPTIRRIRAFSQAWGFGALTVVNLYAWRATDPRDLWQAPGPVGPENDAYLVEACTRGVRTPGQPRHPLYLRGDLTPQPWREPRA